LAELDDTLAGQKCAARQVVAKRGDHLYVLVTVRDHEIDALGLNDPAQRPPVSGPRGSRYQVIPVGGRFLEYEPVVVAANDEKRRIAGLQTADQIVTRPRACAGDQQSLGQTAIRYA